MIVLKPVKFEIAWRTGTRLCAPATAIITVLLAIGFSIGQEESGDPAPDSPKTQVSESGSLSTTIVDEFTPSITDEDLDQGMERAWEFRPYRVAVWLCLDGSPELNAAYPELVAQVTRQSELIDPSGWDLAVGKAPSQWRWKFQSSIEFPEKCHGFESLPMLESYDKLIVVCLDCSFGQTHYRVREFDMQTRQWGPLLVRKTMHRHQLASSIMKAVKVAFMPLAKIDRVTERDNKDEVFLQARAIDACVRTQLNSDLEWEVVPIEDSPVYIKDDDRFLPVIRLTDQKGNLVSLNPIDFTFLTIEKNEGSQIQCSIESYLNSPLAGRSSKRAEKLALVIRPPQQPTTLYLESRTDPKVALEGFEILSRRPGMSVEEPLELLGKTDWRGSIVIPPSAEGMRIIYVQRGARKLKKLPIIPGFRDQLVTTLPNDEASLFAEGILLGIQQEILNLVIQRQVYESDIADFLKVKQLDEAKLTFQAYQALESPREIKTRMADEEVRLKTRAQDKRESDYISRRFEQLRVLLNSRLIESKENELQLEIQKQSNPNITG